MNERWKYDGSIDKYPIKPGEIWEQNGDTVAINDIFDGLPDFMLKADLVFIDPPWNLGNANAFITKNGQSNYHDDFTRFYKQVFKHLKTINPITAYVEIGKEFLGEFLLEMKKQFKYVTAYNSTYYHKKENKCYIIRGSNKTMRPKPKLDDMDEEDIISWICEHEEFSCIGDFVMGRGLVGQYARKHGKPFVGCELNPNRLAVLINKLGGEWNITKEPEQEEPVRQLIAFRGQILDPVEIINDKIAELAESGMPRKAAREKIARIFGVKALTIYRWTNGTTMFPLNAEDAKKLVSL